MPVLECNYVENRIFAACTKSMGTRNRHMIIIIMINKLLVRRKEKGVKIGEKRKEKKGREKGRNKE